MVLMIFWKLKILKIDLWSFSINFNKFIFNLCLLIVTIDTRVQIHTCNLPPHPPIASGEISANH